MNVFLCEQHEDKLSEVIKMINREILYNSDFSGIEYELFIDTCSSVEDINENAGSFLLDKIHDICYPMKELACCDCSYGCNDCLMTGY